MCFAEPEWFEATGTGKVRTFSILRRTHSKQYVPHLPIVLALIALDEGSEMISTIVGSERLDTEIGATVEFAGDGGWSTLPQFRLARTDGHSHVHANEERR